METKGHPKVGSLQGSSNVCMQWAGVDPPADERKKTRGGERDEGGVAGWDRWIKHAHPHNTPWRLAASQIGFLWIRRACPQKQSRL